MEEFWRDVRDYEGMYQVSNLARVKSVERTIIRGDGKPLYVKEKILRQTPNKGGYLQVNLYKNGAQENKKVHQLVAEAFIENPHCYDTVHHINHDKSDNRIENLQWISKHEHQAMHNVERCSKTVYQYTRDKLLVNVWKSTIEIERVLGYNNRAISNCCNGGYPDKSRPSGWHKMETYKGYRWSYKPL